MMKLQLLVSTMHQSDYSLLEKMNIHSDAVVINQCDRNGIIEFEYETYNIKWVNSTQRGLSKSRNMALEHAWSDICVFSDDDLIYVDEYPQIILANFQKYPKADIITFQVEGIQKKFKNYHSKARKLNYLSSMKISSVEIAFRLNTLQENKIKFNELFGSGAKYSMGEENILLYDFLKKGSVINYEPTKIANLHIGNSSWFNGFTKEYFLNRGAVFTGMSKCLSKFMILQFAIRKYKLYGDQLTCNQAIKYMLIGRRSYIKDLKTTIKS